MAMDYLKKIKLPENYSSKLGLVDTEIAIKLCKDTFERKLAEKLGLIRVSAPLFVEKGSGLNDDLNGVERPVAFDVLETGKITEIVHSLAKWKRFALAKYGLTEGRGIYTDMNAIRRDESTDAIHSIYVDQWDWEKVISRNERNLFTLKNTVNLIFSALKETEEIVCNAYPVLGRELPDSVTFISSQELEDQYPDLTPSERENVAAKKYGAIFIIGIGAPLKSGKKHDGRAPDYDDWQLNGDLILWYDLLERGVEISSMGIRVDEKSLLSQLESENKTDRLQFPFHKALINGKLPLTMGGGLGQSRICLFLLKKAHIGEVQASIWPTETVEICEKHNVHLL